jgi:alcohol dehydrogenase class IV/protocatechuate 3,4-dioxygenase beta subunit
MRSFTQDVPAAPRVVFGRGLLPNLTAELDRLGVHRPLVLAGRRLASVAAQVKGAVAVFDGAAMHTPVEVTERALAVLRAHDADGLVAIGGGSAIGLAKALCARTGLPQLVLPTTYAGSEVTPVLGETENGRKTTRRSADLVPSTVLYDVDLTLGLPAGLTVTSAVNALAHAAEALYSPGATPVSDGLAKQAIAGIAAALPKTAADPSDVDSRAALLEAAWLAGTCLELVPTGIHHALCHALGGTFELPHAATHTVVLPHVLAFMPGTEPIARALGAPEAASGVYDLVNRLGGPTSLRELGLKAEDIPVVAAQVAEQKPEFTAAALTEILRNAWHGHRPGGRPDLKPLTDQVVASFGDTQEPRLKELLTGLVGTLHRYVGQYDVTEAEWQRAIDFLTAAGHITDDKRQEFVLLSDTLGVSSAVDLLTNSRSPDSTSSAVLGPFYVPGPPETPQGANLGDGLQGEPLAVDVRFESSDGTPLAGAVVDVWQSNDDGFYDVQLPDLDGPVLRARFRADDQGKLQFRTILPSAYPIPQDGPVGVMLRSAGRHPWRAPHLHFMISAPGHRRLITQLFVAGGDYLDSDTVFGVKEDLIVDFRPELTYTFRLSPE